MKPNRVLFNSVLLAWVAFVSTAAAEPFSSQSDRPLTTPTTTSVPLLEPPSESLSREQVPVPAPVISESEVPRLDQVSRPHTRADLLTQLPASVPTPSPGTTSTETIDPATAQVEDGEDEEEITVTGTRTPRPVRLSPANITVFDTDYIDRNNVRDLRDLLQYEPNVTTGNNRRYGLQDVNIRGLGGNRVLIQTDGIRVPNQFIFGTPSLGRDYVELETLQAVEVLRGPASALYGSDALGGVVTFRTVEASDLLNRYQVNAISRLSADYDTSVKGTVFSGISAYRVGALDVLFSFTRRDSFEASVPVNNDLVDPRTTDRNNYLGKLVYNLDDYSSLSFTGEFFDNRDRFRVNDRLVSDLLGPAGFRGLAESLTADTERSRFSLAYNFADADSTGILQGARFTLYYQDSRILENRIQDFGRTGAGADQRRLRNLSNTFVDRVLGGEIQLQSNFFTGDINHRLSYGIEISTTRNERIRDGIETRFNAAGAVIGTTTQVGADNFPVKDFPDSDTFRFGLYLQDEIEFGKSVSLIPGIRFDTYSLTASPDAIYARNIGAVSANFSSSAVSPSVGVVYRATPELAFVGRYARGFRAPLYSEINSGFSNLVGPGFRYRTLANPNLRPETSDNFEIGVRAAFPQASFSLTGFYNLYDNFIETFAAAGVSTTIVPGAVVNLFQTQNVARAQIYGLEFSGRYNFSPDNLGFSLLASFGISVGDDLTSNRPLETVNPYRLVTGLRYREQNWGADLTASFVGQPRLRSDRPANAFTPAAYTVVDLTGYYNITPLVTLNLGIYNLFNTQYFEYQDVRTLTSAAAPINISNFAQPGISLRAGLSWRF